MRIKTALTALAVVAALGMNAQAQQDLIEFTLEVPFMSSSPVADGAIAAGEYDNSFFFSFGDEENPGNPFPGLNKMFSIDDSADEVEVENDDQDLSATLHMAYTDTYLFMGFEVTDQFINEDGGTPFNNDSVELAIDADADGNDGRNWSREGFKITADVLGQLSNDGGGTADANGIEPDFEQDPEEGFYYAAAEITDAGYNIEFQIPLASMDTFDDDREDGLPDEDFVAAKAGDILRMNFAINDIDLEVGGQGDGTHGMGWLVEDNPASPWGGAEEVWAIGLELSEGSGIDGDYNGNGELDAGDLDVQAQYAKDGVADGDLDGDGDTDGEDRIQWIESLQNSYVGDANFDGEFNSGDLVTTFGAGKYETGEAATYAQGDFDGDMLFNSADFVAAFSGGGYEIGPRAATAAVPEPGSAMLLVLGGLGLMARRRR